MIHEPQTERNYSLWIDGYLPENSKLVEIISKFENLIGENYRNLQEDRKKKPRSYVHLLKPKSLIGSTGIYNPIMDEDHGIQNTKQYRLFGLFAEEFIDDPDKDMKSLKESFLKTLNECHFDIKHEESYRDIENVRSHLTELSRYILDGLFFPYSHIRRGLQNIGFESDEFTF